MQMLPAKGVIKTKKEPIMSLGLNLRVFCLFVCLFVFFPKTIKMCYV